MAMQEPESDPEPLKLEQIRQIDNWRMEWGFSPYEKAVNYFKGGYQGGQFQTTVKHIRSAYRDLAAMTKQREG